MNPSPNDNDRDVRAADAPAGLRTAPASQPASPQMNPGDEAPAGTPGTGENICRRCGGSGRTADVQECPACAGTGRVIEGIGGA